MAMGEKLVDDNHLPTAKQDRLDMTQVQRVARFAFATARELATP
jgi:hypothetical protein